MTVQSKVGCISAKSLQIVLAPSHRLLVGLDWVTKVTPGFICNVHLLFMVELCVCNKLPLVHCVKSRQFMPVWSERCVYVHRVESVGDWSLLGDYLADTSNIISDYYVLMLSPPDSVGEDVTFSGCLSAVFIRWSGDPYGLRSGNAPKFMCCINCLFVC